MVPGQLREDGALALPFRGTPRLVDPSEVLSREFSSARGWAQNVGRPLRRAGIDLPGKSLDASAC